MFSSAGCAYHVLCAVCMCLVVNQVDTNHNCYTETCNPARTYLLMNPDQNPKPSLI